jgi:glycosyltransferase involved in cell wall biosynthesis
MKILHIITRLNVGGTSTYLANLTESLEKLGCENIIAHGYCEKNEFEYLDMNKMVSQTIEVKYLHKSFNFLDDLATFFAIRKLIIELRPDIVNTHTSKAGVLGRLAAKSLWRSIPVVHTYHGQLLDGYFNKFKLVSFTLIERIMAKFTNAIITISKDTLIKLQNKKIGLNLEWFVVTSGVKINNTKRSMKQDEKKFKLLWIGRFTKIKNPEYAVKTFRCLLNHHDTNSTLTMIGDGELLDYIKKISHDLPVDFLGFIPNHLIDFASYDLLMLTSDNEGLGLVVLEAANYYVPSISRNVGGVTEFIADMKTGFLVNGDPEEMAQKIMHIKDNKSDLNKVGIKAHEFLKINFSSQKMGREHLDIYGNLIIGN